MGLTVVILLAVYCTSVRLCIRLYVRSERALLARYLGYLLAEFD